jgi:protein SCO1/2
MLGMSRRSWLAMLATAPVVATLSTWAKGSDGGRKKEERVWQDIPPRELIRERHLPDVPLVTQKGKTVRFYEDLVKDKKVVINFLYTHCQGICVPVTANLVRVQKLLGDRVGRDIFFYSITLKPEEDTPEALDQYAALHGVGRGWLFLTGTPDDIELLRRKLGFRYDDPVEDADRSNHTGMIRVGNEPYLRWSACPGMAAPAWIAKDILLEVDGPTRPGPSEG